MTKEDKGKDQATIFIILIFLIAGYLRFRQLSLTAFSIDEAISCLLALKFIYKGVIPLVGVKTSLYFYNPPLLIYLLTPMLLITSSPLFPLVFIALGGLVGIYLCYRIVEKELGQYEALIVALALAVSPIAVFTSRRLWGHSFVAFMSIIIFFLMVQWIRTGKPSRLLWIILLIILAQSFHFSAAIFWVDLVLLAIIFRPKLQWKWILLGFGLGLITYIPYLIHLVQTGFLDIKIVIHTILKGAPELDKLQPSSLKAAFFFLGDAGRNDLMGRIYHQFLTQLGFYPELRFLMGCLLGVSIVVAALYSLTHCYINVKDGKIEKVELLPKSQFLLICLVWLVVPVAVFSLLRVRFVPYYLLPVLPVPFIFIGWLVHYSRESKCLLYIIGIIIAFWCFGQVLYINHTHWILDRAGFDDQVHTCYRYKWQATQFINSTADNRPCLVVQNWRPAQIGLDYSYVYLLWRANRKPELFAEKQNFTTLFIIIDSLRPVEPNYLLPVMGRCQYKDFGNIRVYFLPGSAVSEALREIYQI